MALQYNYTKLADIDRFDDVMHKEASQFAWVMAAIGINNINAKNINEIVFRLKFAEKCGTNFVTGSLSVGSLKTYIQSMIGYETNVKNETRSSFMRKIMRTVENTVKGQIYFNS
jgi:hypothetical protein